MKPIKKFSFSIFKKILSVFILSTFALTTSGCVQGIFPLPTEQRYQYIHEVRDDLDLKTAGTILEEKYDDSDGVFNRSYLNIILEGEDALKTIKNRAFSISNADCDEFKDGTITCLIGQVDLNIGYSASNQNEVYINITDPFNGRKMSTKNE